MTHSPQINIPAVYMHGGTSKGVLFRLQDLPEAARFPGETRDKLIMRVLGSLGPHGQQIAGTGVVTSGTIKSVIVSQSARPCHDVDCLFGQVSIDKSSVDWSGHCGNLSAALGPFAIRTGLIHRERIPQNGTVTVRIWQANIGKTIVAHVPVVDGQVQETGEVELDSTTLPAAEVQLEFMDPVSEKEGSGATFPTGNMVDELEVPGVGTLQATMINAGVPTIFVNAADVGYSGTALKDAINGDPMALAMFELIRAHGAVRMGLIEHVAQAARRQHTPRIAFIAPAVDYVSSSGKRISTGDVDMLVCALSMGKLHHAVPGAVAVAIGTAAAVPGTLVSLAAGGRAREAVHLGHPSGTLRIGAVAREIGGEWIVTKAVMSRSARVLMDGPVGVPDYLAGQTTARASVGQVAS